MRALVCGPFALELSYSQVASFDVVLLSAVSE
jgi:hypothetical protein